MVLLACCRRATGPRRLDPHQAAKIKDASLRRYRKSVLPFCTWLDRCGLIPCGADEWDDALVEFKSCNTVSKSEFENMVAGVEFFFPRFRGKLAWARQVLAGWAAVYIPKHTVPLGLRPAKLLAAHLCAAGHAKLGFGLLLQQNLGLRPSEMLNVHPGDVSITDSRGDAPATATVALGVRSGTKAKRAQAVTLRDPFLVGLMRWAVSQGQAGEPIVPYTYENYRRLLNKTCLALHLEQIGWTPHSPRAGFASEAIASGADFVAVREAGRWVADSSLRTYIDLQRVATIGTELQLAGFAAALDWADEHLGAFFIGARHFLESHGGEGLEDGGRCLLPAVDALPGQPWEATPVAEPQARSRGDAAAPRARSGRGGGRGRSSAGRC